MAVFNIVENLLVSTWWTHNHTNLQDIDVSFMVRVHVEANMYYIFKLFGNLFMCANQIATYLLTLHGILCKVITINEWQASLYVEPYAESNDFIAGATSHTPVFSFQLSLSLMAFSLSYLTVAPVGWATFLPWFEVSPGHSNGFGNYIDPHKSSEFGWYTQCS